MSTSPLTYEEQYDLEQTILSLEKDIILFGKMMFPSALTHASPWFHREICRYLLDKSIDRLLVAAPRGSAKSTVDSLLYPTHRIAFKKPDEEVFIVIISEAQKQSINFLNRIKFHLETSVMFKTFFGTHTEATARRWTRDDVILSNGIRIAALGTGQSPRGFIEGDTRITDIILDDFESELNANTREARSKNRLWMQNAVVPSLSDDGRILMLGTPISEDCYLYWAKNSGAWKVLWYRICQNLEKLETDPNDLSNLLWPSKFPAKRVLKIKAEQEGIGNLNGFWQEYMCFAQSPESAPFKPEHIRYHNYKLETIHNQHCLVRTVNDSEEIIPVTLFLGVDPASSLALRADFFVIAVLAIDEYGNVYVVDFIRGRYPPSDQPQLLIDTYKRYPGRRMKIETTAYQEALRSGTRALVQELGLYIPGLESGVKPRTPKSERLLSLVPLFARGKFYFRAEKDVDAAAEFLSYPRGKHDDRMDAIWTALEGARPPKGVEITRDNAPNINARRYNWKAM